MDKEIMKEKEIFFVENQDYRFETGFHKRNEIDVIDGIKIINPLHRYRFPW